MFGKHFASMYSGSMFGKPAVVFAVWGYVISHMRPERKTGECHVELNPSLLAATFATTPEEIAQAIDTLVSPDERSRTEGEDGKRLVLESPSRHLGPMQFRVVNGPKYRELRDEEERRQYLTMKKRESRARSTKVLTSLTVNRRQPTSTQAEAEAEAEVVQTASVESVAVDSERAGEKNSVRAVARAAASNWVAEACDDWTNGGGGTAPGGKIGKALKPLVAKVAREKGIEFDVAWSKVRPFWRKFCDSDDRRFGPQAFAENPRRVIEGKGKESVAAHNKAAIATWLAQGGGK